MVPNFLVSPDDAARLNQPLQPAPERRRGSAARPHPSLTSSRRLDEDLLSELEVRRVDEHQLGERDPGVGIAKA